MVFLLQGDNNEVQGIEEFKLKALLKRGGNKYLHCIGILPNFDNFSLTYGDLISLNPNRPEFSKNPSKAISLADCVPIGNLIFVEQYLRLFEKMNGILGTNFLEPIEVPVCLRKLSFLQRGYDIVPFNELDLDRYSFIKNASELKQYSYTGVPRDALGMLSANVFYVQSSIIPIKSEYRVLVLDNKIRGIQHYEGDCLLFPDLELLKEMVYTLSLDSTFPTAYTLDLAVTDNYTCVLEAHNFVSCGTYGFEDDCLTQMYTRGIQYELDRMKEGN